MINLSRILSGKPILITNKLYFTQPTLQEIADTGEDLYWVSLNLWTLKRKDLLKEENELTKDKTDYEIWINTILADDKLKNQLLVSCLLFFKAKVDFFPIAHTIYIGEKDSGAFLDQAFYELIRAICEKIIKFSSGGGSSKSDDEQFKETDNMSEKERRMLEKMKASQKMLDNKVEHNPEDVLGKRIIALSAIGSYTLEQVYNMTMLQLNMLLEKYVEVQSFELRTQLSPYISSENKQGEDSFWL